MIGIKLSLLIAVQLAVFATASVSTYSQSICATRLTTKKPASVPTSTRAYTLTFNPKVTTVITNTYTVTPSSATVTNVVTSISSTTTTVTQVTDTFTFAATATISDTTTTTLVGTETEFSTALTTSYGTYTVPASAGFTPLASALAASGNTAAKRVRRGERLQSRVAEGEAACDVADLEKRGNSGEFYIGGPNQYPAAVICTKLVEIVSTLTVKLTAKKTSTVTESQGTLTETSTKVLTTTLTEVPVDASVTETASTTTHITSTATATSTTTTTLATTATVFAPIATSYGACNPDNIVSTINGKFITNIHTVNGVASSFYYVQRVTNAYDCCVACLQSDTCGAALFRDNYMNIALKQCFQLGDGGVCSGSTPVVGLVADGGTGEAFIASNGNCGQFAYP